MYVYLLLARSLVRSRSLSCARPLSLARARALSMYITRICYIIFYIFIYTILSLKSVQYLLYFFPDYY